MWTIYFQAQTIKSTMCRRQENMSDALHVSSMSTSVCAIFYRNILCKNKCDFAFCRCDLHRESLLPCCNGKETTGRWSQWSVKCLWCSLPVHAKPCRLLQGFHVCCFLIPNKISDLILDHLWLFFKRLLVYDRAMALVTGRERVQPKMVAWAIHKNRPTLVISLQLPVFME